jgi:hypothetical protein
MQQRLPPTAWNEFGENNGSELAIIVLLVRLFEKLQQRRDNRPIWEETTTIGTSGHLDFLVCISNRSNGIRGEGCKCANFVQVFKA